MSTGVGVEFTTDTRRARKVFDSATALARQSGPVLAAGPSSPGKLWSVWFQDDGDIIFGCQFGSLPVDARSDYCREHRQVDGLGKCVGTVRSARLDARVMSSSPIVMESSAATWVVAPSGRRRPAKMRSMRNRSLACVSGSCLRRNDGYQGFRFLPAWERRQVPVMTHAIVPG